MIDQADTATPKVSVVDAGSLSLGPFTTATLNPEVVAAVGQLTADVRDGITVALAEMGERVAEQIRAVRRTAQALTPPEAALDMSPRAVALRSRQNRHTGPRGTARTHRRR